MKIIIPMAGWGTRLRPHTLTVPKPLIKVAGKSVVQRLVETIVDSLDRPATDVVFVIKPAFGQAVENELLDTAARLGLNGHIRYQKEALGTAHAIYMARDFLDGPVFVAYADTLFDGQIPLDPEADSVIVVKQVDNPEQFGVVQLDDEGYIRRFVEKPKSFVSDLAIVGIYYFKEGGILKKEIEYLMDNGIMRGGEYQLTDALENMLRQGLKFKPAGIREWMDFGNYRAAVDTTRTVLTLEQQKGRPLVSDRAVIRDSKIIEPCYIGPDVVIEDSTVGPYVSIEDGTHILRSEIAGSLIGRDNHIEDSQFSGSMIGNHTHLAGLDNTASLGDYARIEND